MTAITLNVASLEAASPSPRDPNPLSTLRNVIEHAAHYLPAQGPITVFIHHNTLHAFEDMPFDAAVVEGGKLFGCQPYLSEDRYRTLLAAGRIQVDDLRAALLADLGDYADALLGFLGTRFHFRLSMLQHPVRQVPAAELQWFVAETDALSRFRPEVTESDRRRFLAETKQWLLPRMGAEANPPLPELFARLAEQLGGSPQRWSEKTWEKFVLQSLWRACRNGAHGLKPGDLHRHETFRHRDELLKATGNDADSLVHDLLIRYCSAFLDQGLSHWLLPGRGEGFYRAFLKLYQHSGGPPDAWLEGLPAELTRLERNNVGPLASILESLKLLGISNDEWEPFLTSTLLALRGWAGMIRQMELRTDRVAFPVSEGSLVEFLAVRLILDRFALRYVARESAGFSGPLAELRHALHRREVHEGSLVDQRAFLVFRLAQTLGWMPWHLHALTRQEWTNLIGEIEAFGPIERRRVFHAAYERRYRVQSLDALALHKTAPLPEKQTPRFQLACCLDEREESFRRHLEEIDPQVETFGAAGFYNIAMYYRGAADATFVPLCPIIIQPKHWVVEDVAYTDDELHGRRAVARRALGKTSHRLHMGTRTIFGGALIAGLGALAAIPLVARVLFPRLTARIRRTFGGLVQPPKHTHLRIERTDADPGAENGHIGYALEEMADIGERLLRDIGLTKQFARLVVILGHGSNSLNNPHNSAYNCGACGGSAGGPNGRAFAHMMNDPRVRRRLAERGIIVPSTTWFIGGLHNTCNDEVTFHDLDRLPSSHLEDFEHVRAVVGEACERNAHERCRRFESAPLTLSFEGAKRHVEGRSEDLAQTRPELGHATNALCIVARRERTRGLYLDRRAFLTTYDPTQDDAEYTILTRLMQAAVPVCAGINLEYYFSHVDSVGWGCGTKLPHNVASLLGVMDGAASDLRPGLPWQMTELHEPVRLLFVVETTPQAMLQLMERNPNMGRLFHNGWVQLAVLSPDSQEIQMFCGDHFELYRCESSELPHAASSADWYRGRREHLGFATVGPTGNEGHVG